MDALVAAEAVTAAADVLTGDADDLRALLVGHPSVTVIPLGVKILQRPSTIRARGGDRSWSAPAPPSCWHSRRASFTLCPACVPDEPMRNRILVDNASKLYGFAWPSGPAFLLAPSESWESVPGGGIQDLVTGAGGDE